MRGDGHAAQGKTECSRKCLSETFGADSHTVFRQEDKEDLHMFKTKLNWILLLQVLRQLMKGPEM